MTLGFFLLYRSNDLIKVSRYVEVILNNELYFGKFWEEHVGKFYINFIYLFCSQESALEISRYVWVSKLLGPIL